MCFATVAAGAAIAGTAMQVVGQISSGYQQAAQAQAEGEARAYQAQVARNNALIAERQARLTEVAAAQQAQAESMKLAARMGRIKTAQAASGVDVNTGSAVDVQAGSRLVGKLDVDTLFSNKMLDAYGYRVKATDYEAAAGLEDRRSRAAYSRASDAVTSGWLKAGGTLLSNAASLPLKWGGGGGGGGSSNYLDYGGVAGPAW